MVYYAGIAEKRFMTSGKGERLFYRGGPWSRPFIIPDADTEWKLYKKSIWMNRISLGLITLLSILVKEYPKLLQQQFLFLIFLATSSAVVVAIGRIVYARELRTMQRAPVRLGAREYYRQMGERHSMSSAVLRFLVSILFIAFGIWNLKSGTLVAFKMSPEVSIICICFFSLTAVAWGYTFYLKLRAVDPSVENQHA